MRARISLLVCAVLVIAGITTGFFAPLPQASAQQLAAAECGSARSIAADDRRPFASNGDSLLTTDGRGFFTENLTSMAVRSASTAEAVGAATDAVAQSLIDFYFGSRFDVFVNSPGRSSRVVVLDDDISVPGHPKVLTIGGVQTLYLHWTTAEADITRLLDVPSFQTLSIHTESTTCLKHVSPAAAAVQPDDGPSDDSAQDTTVTDTLLSVDTEPNNVLAYVDDEPDSTQSQRTPLADTSPPEQWPFPVAAAAILVATGGVVLQRRDKIWGDRYAPVAQPAEAMIQASKPSLPVADLPPSMPRVIVLDEDDAASPEPQPMPGANREIDLHPKRAESPLERSVEKLSSNAYGVVLSRQEFARHVNTEWERHQLGGADGAVASLVLSELDAVRRRLGNDAASQLFEEVADQVAVITRSLDVIGLANENELAILMRNVDEAQAAEVLERITKKIAATTFETLGERVLLTPATGFALLSDTHSAPDLIRAVEHARTLSMLNLHLDPERWGSTAETPHAPSDMTGNIWASIKTKLRTPVQILATIVIAWILPFFIYVGMAAIGFDITFLVYLFVVISLVMTGVFILAEGSMAIKQKEPPELESSAYPKATALIAAYMPNEAETVIETIDAFLALDYPNDVQIILAYNTPDPMPVEEHLDRIAAEHPNFVPVRIVGSTSKAQNVNAALSMATGEFIGMFDADHQPRPDAFTRAWRWIDDGYDVVQGHCLTRNGDECFLAKMIAVEFESIYAVAHPGRAKMHRFGVFGGSNGFWRTELLHETRMRGSMLTEDIDSSMRVVERGFKIRSDRDLVSRELATTTFTQIWNQRMRWAQGWFQVSMEHMKLAYRSGELTFRQKLGVFHLMMWREFYPWLSQQLFPLVAFWAIRAGGLGNLDWAIPIFVATSIFTFSVGPLQTVFAYKLADQEIKQHKSWFWAYLFFNTFFYTEYKNLIARVAHVKQFMGESEWRVTPRSTGSDDC